MEFAKRPAKVTAFMKESRKIGKTGDVTLTLYRALAGAEGEGTGMFPKRGLQPLTLTELQALLCERLGASEQQYRMVLGL